MSVHVIATGGTISSHFDGTTWHNLDGATLVAELGATANGVTVEDIAAGPSSNLSVDDMVRVVGSVKAALDRGVDGVVVLHGTDTMELTSFVAQLLLGTSVGRRPVVFTGAMRVHSHSEPDGLDNLRDAIAVASSPLAVGSDVMVCLDGLLHSARYVAKVSAASLDAFSSSPCETIGAVHNGQVLLRSAFEPLPSATSLIGPVPIVTCYPGIAADTVDAAIVGAVGVVVEGFGDLNVPRALWRPLHRAAQDGALVAIASRPFTPTTTSDGLQSLGVIGVGGLSAQKARLAVMAALGSTVDRDAATAFVHSYAIPYDAHDRSTN